MPVFKEMNPQDVWKAIEGYEDILQPEAKKNDHLYRTFKCLRCNSDLRKEFDGKHVFDGQSLVPRALLRCPTCNYLIDPHTHIVLDTGNPTKVPDKRIPIIDPKD